MSAADAEGAARCGEFPEAQTTTEEVPVRAKGKTPKPTAVAEDQKHKSLSIEWWPIDRPKPYERNARRIPQSAIDKVAASIKEFGWRQSLVVDKKDVLIAGHARLLAARQLGLKSVPVHVADNLSPEQVKQYRLMDNRSHEALWDVEKLNLELIDLKDLDLNLTGFDSHEISSLTDIESFPWLYQTEHVKIGELRAHPKNFRIHPEDQIEHIIESVRKNGLYRTVVVAADGTILAGHGIVAAYRKMGRKSIEVVRLSVEPDSIEAMKVLIGDNDISGRGKQDDRALAEILKEIKGRGGDLFGTGYTDELFAGSSASDEYSRARSG